MTWRVLSARPYLSAQAVGRSAIRLSGVEQDTQTAAGRAPARNRLHEVDQLARIALSTRLLRPRSRRLGARPRTLEGATRDERGGDGAPLRGQGVAQAEGCLALTGRRAVGGKGEPERRRDGGIVCRITPALRLRLLSLLRRAVRPPRPPRGARQRQVAEQRAGAPRARQRAQSPPIGPSRCFSPRRRMPVN
jgi:hypothetical protein